MRRIGKGFLGVDTLLFDGMLVPQQAHDVEDATEDEDDVNETCATLTKQIANLEQDKIAQDIEITKLKQRVKRLEKNRKFKSSSLKRLRKVGITKRVESSADTIMDDPKDASKQGEGEIAELDADEDVTLEEVDVEVTMDVDVQGRLEESQAKYTSPALTQKVFANMRRIGKGFLGVDTLLFDGMLVPQQAQDVEDATEDEDDVNEVSAEPTLPSPTPATPTPPPQQEHIPSPPQAQTAQPSSPQQQQPSQTTKILMTLLNTLLETCATLTKQIANLEQDKIAQDIEITKLKQRVKRLEKNRKFKSSSLKRLRKGEGEIAELDADEDVTLEEVDAEVTMDVDVQGRLEESQAKHYNLNQDFLERVEEEVTCQEEEGSKRKDDSLEKRAAKKQKIDEETEELKTHLQIIPNDDDVYTEATPLALKYKVTTVQIVSATSIIVNIVSSRIMDTTRAQQKALDDELVAPANHLKIWKRNLRLSPNLNSKEPTLQVVLDALKLTSFYKAFEITADVPKIHIQEFWIYPNLPGQKFKDLPFEEEILSFIRELGHTGEIKVLSDVNVNHMHQPWRSFAAIINKCLSEKTTALECLCLLRTQILWGMYHNKNVDYVYLMWEDLVFQVENKNSKKNNDVYYPRFTKVIGKDSKLQLKCLYQGLETLSEIALSEAEQIKLATKRSKIQFHSSHTSGSGADEGTGVSQGVPDVPTYDSDDEQIS
nr:hypothetical protein [Tanacetum cinerariifolium]